MNDYYNSDEDSVEIVKKKVKYFEPPTPPPPPPTPEPEPDVDTSLFEKGLLGILGIIGGAFFYLRALKLT